MAKNYMFIALIALMIISLGYYMFITTALPGYIKGAFVFSVVAFLLATIKLK
jgi:hypothetical protein